MRGLTATGLVLGALLAPSSAESAVVGSLTQLPGRSGCVQAGSPQGCDAARGLDGADFVTVSRDDAYVYTVSFEGIAVFARNRPRGTLSQLPASAGCIRDSASPDCARARGVAFAEGSNLTLTHDGRHAYVVNSAGIGAFARDPASGVLNQLPGAGACLLPRTFPTCTRARGIDAVTHVAESPDGRNVYAAAYNSGAVAVFSRDRATGSLSQLPGSAGCMSVRRDEGCTRARAIYGVEQIAISRDGRNLYVAAWEGVAAFSRNPATGRLRQLPGSSGCMSRRVRACAHVRGLGEEPGSVALSPDQRQLYVGSATCADDGICRGSVSAFRRDRRTGALSRLRGRAGCVSRRGEPACRRARAIYWTDSIAISADGRSAYAAGANAVAVFSRSRRSGALRQLRGPLGAVRVRGLPDISSVAISADGRTVYATSQEGSSLAILARRTAR